MLSRAVATTVIVSVVAASFVGVPVPAPLTAAADATAAATGSPDGGLTEMPGLRTLTTKTFATGTAGRYVTRAFDGPVHYPGPDGWLDIDTSLVSSGTGIGRLRNKGNSFTLDLGGNGADPSLARIAVDATHAVSFALAGALPVAADLEGDGRRIRLSSVLPDVDITLESRVDGLKEDIVLHSPLASDRYLFPLVLENLTASIDTTGAVVFRDENGAERLRTPAGWMEDANVDPNVGDGAISHGVTYDLVELAGSGIALEVRLDRAWLDDPARVYPVTVDPSFQVYAAYDDTFVQRTVTNVRHDSLSELRAGTYDSGTNIVRSFLHFDFSPINGKIINSATMYLWNFHSWECNTPRYVNVFRVTQGWDGAMTAWPGVAYDGTPIAQSSFGFGNGCSSGWGTWNIRDAVAGWTGGAYSNHGVMIGTNESDNFYWKKFASRNSCSCEGAGSTGPHVDVDWSEPPAAGQDPIGSLDLVSPGYEQVRLGGWALDPDTTASIQVDVWANGSQYLGALWAGGYRPDVDAVYGRGPYHGFDGTLNAPSGTHQICAWAINHPGTGGSHRQFGCQTVTIAQDHWPFGGIDSASGGYEQIHLAGWAIDRDNGNHQLQIDVWANGSQYLGWLSANTYRPDVDAVHRMGAWHGFDGTLPAPAGTHSICLYAINWPTSARYNTNLGCRTLTIAAKTPPSMPQSVTATPGPRSAAVTWSAPASNGGAAIDHYLVRAYKADGTPAGIEKTAPVGQTAALVDGLSDNTTYWFNVYAHNSVGYSTPGTSNTITTPALASTLTGQLVAQSDELGLEQFQAYAHHDLGDADAYVQLRTGNLVVQQRDVRVPVEGLNVVVRRTYNSQDARDVGLGTGWRLSVSDLDAGLEGADGAVVDVDPAAPLTVADIVSVVGNATQVTGQLVDFTDGDGTTHRFVRTGPLGRRWDSPPGVSLRLREVTGTGGVVVAYELVRPDGVVYRAQNLQSVLGLPSATWVVTSVTDRNQNQLTYAYTTVAVGGVAKARLSTIKHSRTGNETLVSFLWDASGRLSSITSLPSKTAEDPAVGPPSRSWARRTNFTYSSGHLATVTENAQPGSNATRSWSFGYDANNVLDRVTDPRNNPSTFGYQLDAGVRRANRVTDRRVKNWTYTYNAIDPSTGERTTVATSPVGATTTYRTTGRAAVSGSDARITGGNIKTITDLGNNAGPVSTSYEWVENRLTAKTDGTGNRTSMTYNDLGLVTKVTKPAPNRSDRSDLTDPAYVKGTVDSTLAYAFAAAYRYSDCSEPTSTGPVSKVGYCDAVADMTQLVAASNVTAQRRVTDFGYTPLGSGNLTSVVQRGTGGDPDRTTTFAYYGRGGLCSVDGPRTDVSDVTRYGDAVNIGAACNAGSDPLYGGYDPTGLPPRIRDAAGKSKQFSYTPYGMVAKVVDRENRETRTLHDDRDNPTRTTDPLGRVSTVTYNALDLKAIETSPRGNATGTVGDYETRYTYDANGAVTKVSRPDATDTDATRRVEISTTYNDDGTKATDVSAAGATTSYLYWPNRSLKQTTAPAATGGPAAVTNFEYDLAGRIARTVFPATNTAGTQRPETLVDYTPQGDPSTQRETSAISGQWRTTRFGYNAHGELGLQTGPRSIGAETETTQTVFNAFGEPTTVRRRLVGRWLDSVTGYDAAGNKVRVVQPTGTGGSLESLYRYDALDRLSAQTKDPTNLDHEVTYTYDGEGAQLTRTDMRQTAGPQTSACGDAGVTCVAARTHTTVYNLDGTVQSEVARDEAGRTLATCNWSNPANKAGGYDADRNLLRSRVLSGTAGCDGTQADRDLTLTYDHRGLVDTFTQRVRSPEIGSLVTRLQSFEYRNDGLVTKATHDGQSTSYGLSPAGWVETITDWRGKTSTIGYTPSGAASSENRGDGAATSVRAYKPDGMPSELSWTARGGAVVRRHANIGYDLGGLRKDEDVTVVQPAGAVGASTGGHATWDYDLVGRLTAYTSPYRQLPADSANPVTSYTLDDGGNITRQNTTVAGVSRSDETSVYVNGQLRTRHTVAGLGVLPSDTTWTYTALGEESSESTTGGTGSTANATTYDPAGHTGRVDDQSAMGAAAPNPTDVDYVYDGDDHLLARTERPTTGPVATTLYFYWGTGTALAEEADGAGTAVARYLTDGGTETLGQHTWRRDATGHRDATDTAGTWAWLLDDTNGNTATHVGDDGAVLEQAAFDPYGRPEAAGKGKAANAPGSSLGHQGALTDRTTGNSILGARQYDPTTARFTTPDTFVASSLDLALGTDELTGNRYLFAAANPVAFYEDGHWPKLKLPSLRTIGKIAAIGAGIAGAIACGATVVCAVAVGAAAGAASYAVSKAGTKDFRWKGLVTEAAVGGLTAGIGAKIAALRAARASGLADDLVRAEAARDEAGRALGRKYATYVGGTRRGKVVVGCSSSAGCAEDDVVRQLGRRAKMTKAYGWRRNKATGELEWKEIPVCVKCQAKYSRKQFPPDAKFD